jgi:hypothetical protein
MLNMLNLTQVADKAPLDIHNFNICLIKKVEKKIV